MQPNLTYVIDQVGRDKGIDKNVIIEALEDAMVTAARKIFGQELDLEAQFNDELGEVEIFEFRTVVETVVDPFTEISLNDARSLDPDAEIGDSLGTKLPGEHLGRIAAQTAKQVIIQRVRDAEREMVFTEYKDRKAELITGIVRRFEKGNIIVDLGRAEAILPIREQVPRESYRAGDRVQAYVLDVERTAKGPQIVLSRTDPGLLVKLFELEVPEVYEKVVEIMAAAREPGSRSKVAVYSNDSDVDPVGACVGMRGSRVQAVVQELRGEKIDIIPWDEEPARFVVNALAPAEVTRVIIDEANDSMEIVVPDDQLSLAIGRRGQNVRLAAQLTGWKLDINSESRVREIRAFARRSLLHVEGLTERLFETFYNHGLRAARDVAEADPEQLVRIPGVAEDQVEAMVDSAGQVALAEDQEAKRLAEEAEDDALRRADLREVVPSELSQPDRLFLVEGVGTTVLGRLVEADIDTVEALAEFDDLVKLAEITETSERAAEDIKRAARDYLEDEARRLVALGIVLANEGDEADDAVDEPAVEEEG